MLPHCYCVDPGDKLVPEKHAGHHLTMPQLRDKLSEMLGNYINVQDFNADMPFTQHEFLRQNVVYELLLAQNFTSDVRLRDAASLVIHGMLQ